MIYTHSDYNNMFNSVAREFVGRVELLEGSTLVDIFEHDGNLQSFEVERAGDNSKFFGYGISQKVTVKIRDRERAIALEKGQGLQIAHGIKNNYIYTYPVFYIEEITRDENTNDLTVIGYDAIYSAAKHTVDELQFPERYTLETFGAMCASVLGLPVRFKNMSEKLLNLEYTRPYTNFVGTESIRDAMDDLAEVLGAIYYLNSDWELTFQRLDRDGNAVYVLDKSKYFEFKAKTAHTLETIISVTELGDNLEATSGNPGATQYLRDNAFLTLRDDISYILSKIHEAVEGLTIVQHDCRHRGDFRLEIGDKMHIITKDDGYIVTYALGDTISYNGGLSGTMRWEYTNNNETIEKPSSIGDILKQTYAKVDRASQRIDLVTSTVESTASKVAQLSLTTGQIAASVSNINSDLNGFKNEVSATLSDENLSILVNGSVNSIATTTGFTFDQTGLNIASSTSPTATNVNPNGMVIYTNYGYARDLLTVNNQGVTAYDLTAGRYITVGGSRIQSCYVDSPLVNNKLQKRTGVFWIG